MIYRKYLKRVLDITLAVLLLLALSPLFITISLVLLFVNQGSPFFVQIRAGQYGEPFRIIKFKSMNDKRDAKGELLPDSQRLTRMGLFIRKTSLDEMPQLLNVLKGDLSIVGPRPLYMQYLPHYNAEQSQRHNVKPGITGWAQVNGRQLISFTQRFELDVYYVNNISFKLDMKVMVMTFINLFKAKGVVQDEGPWKI